MTMRESIIADAAVDTAMGLLDEGYDAAGVCVACGDAVESGVEPDAECYACQACGAQAVYGAEQVVLIWGEM